MSGRRCLAVGGTDVRIPDTMRALPLLVLLIAGAFPALASSQAADVTFESGPRRTRLLELYTSEGCSSCPPAEAWLSKLKDHPGLWREFVPLAFHVDYWDRLGWRDPFAAKAWTARQYDYSARWKNGSVYTPGFVLDGREWRNDGVPSAASDSPGTLKVSIVGGDAVSAAYAPAVSDNKPLELHVARLGFDLNTNVKAGENRGRKLLHDFVVIDLRSTKMSDGKAELRVTPNVAAPQQPGTRSAFAAWVTAPGELEPIQAVGGWLQER